MNQPLTVESALSYSPDAASTKAARDLAKEAKWKSLGALDEDEGEVIWGEIQGSSGEAYRTRVAVEEPTFTCSCPSRKRPCKHALALLALRAENPAAFKSPAPSWVENAGGVSGTSSAAGGTPYKSLELPPSWQEVLGEELDKPYFLKLEEFLKVERATHTVYPPAGEEFSALQATPYDQVKVFILGQDPYHGPGQAHGMAFSVRPGVTPPPSLQNMFNELMSELGIPASKHGYLMSWAKQGVLMLNAVLTVRRGEPNSHKGQGWETFTDSVIRAVSAKEERVVFVLWGNYAQKKEKLIDAKKHFILKSAHPSPLSAHNGFFGSKPFSRINEALKEAGREEINWELPTNPEAI